MRRKETNYHNLVSINTDKPSNYNAKWPKYKTAGYGKDKNNLRLNCNEVRK
jgi:hypothetical protein